MKLGIGIAAALALAVVAFLGLRSVLSDSNGAALDSAGEAIEVFEGEGAELDERLQEAGYGAEGEEAFEGIDASLDASEPQLPEIEGDVSSATATATGTATLALPQEVGDAARELLLFEGDTEASVPLQLDVELTKPEDGEWEVRTIGIEDPYPRPAEALPAELESLTGTAENVASGAMSLLGPGFYEQPDIYATPADATKQELLDARASNDQSYPPYLVDVPQSDLITGPVDRALVTAMGCEYNTATAQINRLEPTIPAEHPGPLQVVEFFGSAEVMPTSVNCRRGKPPELPLSAAFVVQLSRSRLSADSEWRVTRLVLGYEGGEPRDVYSVADVTGDEREPNDLILDTGGS